MKIALGSDHAGYSLKEEIKKYLDLKEIPFIDFGTFKIDSSDYPEFAYKVGNAIASVECDRGILICGTGIGMSITANKVRGIRASLCHDELTAEMARRHNDANVLCMPADLLGEEVVERVVEVWLSTPFDGGRHERRVNKISEFESHNGHPR